MSDVWQEGGIIKRKNSWSDAELEILQMHYSKTPKNEILKMLPNRSWRAIQTRAEHYLHLGRNLIIDVSCLKEIRLEEWQKAYIAGLIDGEGSFIATPQPKRNVFGFEITITNTNREALDKIKKLIGFGRIYEDKRSVMSDHYTTRKTGYKYRIYKISEVLPLIKEIKKYLIIRLRQADLLEQMIEQIVKEKKEFGKKVGYVHSPAVIEVYQELKKANKKGLGKVVVRSPLSSRLL